MNKPLKFSSTQKLFWCSDLHMGHEPKGWDTPPLWSTRGFSSISEHDEWIRTKWFEMIDDDTHVFCLGDTVFNDPKGERFKDFTTWPGHIRTLSGNHWSGFRQVFQGQIRQWLPELEEGSAVYPLKINNLIFAGESMHAFIDGTSVFMTHYANYIWPEMKAGGQHVCGHSHSRCVELNPQTTTFGKICDIGVDNAIHVTHTPFFSWPQLQAVMANKPILTHDHH